MPRFNKSLIFLFSILLIIVVGEIVFLSLKNKVPGVFQTQTGPVSSGTVLNPFYQIRDPSKEYAIPLSQIKYFSGLEKHMWQSTLTNTLSGSILAIEPIDLNTYEVRIEDSSSQLFETFSIPIDSSKSSAKSQKNRKIFREINGQKTVISEQELRNLKKGDKISIVRYFNLEEEVGKDFISSEIILY